jgi:predicted small metal-binding protein
LLSFKCLKAGCDFAIEDGEHVDDVLDQLRVHYRAQHPTTYFRVGYAGEEIERYNQSLDEFFISQFGPQWEQQGAARLIRHVQSSLLRAANINYYSPALRAAAQAYVDDNAGAAADPNALAGGVVAVDGADVAFGGGLNWQPMPPLVQDF